MPILLRAASLLSALILISYLPAFAWTNGSSFSTAASSSSAYTTISASSGSLSSGYSVISWSTPSSSFFSVSLPESFRTVISKFDISQSIVPSEAAIHEGLTEALTINNNYLQDNEYKAAMIEPLCEILNSGTYSPETNYLVLQNLELISDNDRISSADKLRITNPLINFTEKSIQSGTESVNALASFHDILRNIFFDPGISAVEKDTIANKLINQESPLWSVGQAFYSVLAALEMYLYSDGTDLTTKNMIVEFEIGMIRMADSNYNLFILNEYIRGLTAATQDSRLNKATLIEISDTIRGLLNDATITLGYSEKLSCTAALYSIARNDKLDTAEKNEIVRFITDLVVNEQNKAIWEEYGILVLAEPEVTAQVDDKTMEDIERFISEIPADKRPVIISLQDILNQGTRQEPLNLVGAYDFILMTADLKINPLLVLKNSCVFHETAHFLQAQVMTKEQLEEWTRLWLESDSLEDFVEEYSMTDKLEDGATVMEAVLKEYYLPDTQKTLLKRAQEQDEASDPTLLNKYRLAEACWGITASSIN